MNVAHPYVLGVWALVALGAVAWSMRRARRATPPTDALRMAHTERLAATRSWRRRVRGYRVLLSVAVLAAFGALGAGALLTARVVSSDDADPRLRARDVMLCLDVSTSMAKPDQQVLREYERLARGFDGERIGLTIFNSAPVSVFPLTNDYDFVVEQLRGVGRSFAHRTRDGIPSIYSGTVFGQTGSSLVGDGLASCLARMHAAGDARRSSSVLLATDNAVGGSPLISLPQAAALARTKGIRVYGLDGSPRAGTSDDAAVEYRAAMRHTGGDYFSLADEDSIDTVIAAVRSRQAAAVPSAPRIVERDEPRRVWWVLCAGVLVLLGTAWKVRL